MLLKNHGGPATMTSNSSPSLQGAQIINQDSSGRGSIQKIQCRSGETFGIFPERILMRANDIFLKRRKIPTVDP
jgi:hypothetical protein